MSQLNINSLIFNYGIHLIGQAPLDDRIVWSSIEDIYVDGENPEDAPMYNKAYAGIHVSIVEIDETTNKADVTLMILKDATPYTPGEQVTVNADNYKEYWSVIGSDIYDKITQSTYFDGGETSPTAATLDKHGNLRKGITITELETMTISEILKAILFETVIATKDTSYVFGASCSWSNYSTSQEIGAAMPTVNNISVKFQPEVYKCITSGGETIATYELSELDESSTVKRYNMENSSTTGGMDMTGTQYASVVADYVTEGAHYFYTDVHYTAYQDAKNSDGTIAKAAYGGDITTNAISFTGAYRIFSNAWATYTNVTTAYANRDDEDYSWDESAKKSTSLMIGTVTLYFKWPSEITSDQEFHIYVPQGYSITSIKAANNTSKDTYDLDATVTKQADSVSIATTNGHATGEYDDYIVTRASGNTNVMVVIK